jgi:hypothetical protein
MQYKNSGHTFAEVHEALGREGVMSGKRRSKKKGSWRIIVPKAARLKEMAENHPGWHLREFAAEFGVRLLAIDKRCEAFGVTRKKTFAYSEKSEDKKKYAKSAKCFYYARAVTRVD